MRDTSPTASKASLDDTLGPPVKCIRCQDRGVIELTAGTHTTIGNSANNWRGRSIKATPENPVYVGCECRRP